VPVDDIMRYAMYAESYRREKDAMQKYARIDPARNASQCIGCSAPCERACQWGIPIREKLTHAHQLLSFT
jgi:predicted aldo/keto reductase-like oxidoreductase